LVERSPWLPRGKNPLDILVTAGASCPDTVVDQVMSRVAEFLEVSEQFMAALAPFQGKVANADSSASAD
jgi:4-hydroxy-3-methylbut-2-enyl diphosphate reductase